MASALTFIFMTELFIRTGRQHLEYIFSTDEEGYSTVWDKVVVFLRPYNLSTLLGAGNSGRVKWILSFVHMIVVASFFLDRER